MVIIIIIIIIIIVVIICLFFSTVKPDPLILFFGLEDGRGSKPAIVGSDVNLTCKVANPTVQNTFEKDGREINEDKHYTFHNFEDDRQKIKHSVLEIKNITLDHEGNYTCVAFRDGLTSKSNFYLKVGAYSNSIKFGLFQQTN